MEKGIGRLQTGAYLFGLIVRDVEAIKGLVQFRAVLVNQLIDLRYFDVRRADFSQMLGKIRRTAIVEREPSLEGRFRIGEVLVLTAFEIGQETAHYIHQPHRIPVLMASSWLVGASTFPTLQLIKEFHSIDSIEIVVVLDEHDMGGPAAEADFVRLTKSAPRPLIVKDGKYVGRTPKKLLGA